jgi:hypothetical protein
MKNPYEEKAAKVVEALQPILALLEELEATTPAKPRSRHRRLRKVTPAVIRSIAADLRSGEAKDAHAAADAIEAELERIEGLRALGLVVQQAMDPVLSKVDDAAAELFGDAMEVYRVARELAETSGDEEMKEHVNRMSRALGRGERG